MAYGARYVRMMAGDPGFFSGIGKLVSKVAAPIAAVSKIPVLGKVLGAVPGVGTALSVASLGASALGAASKTALGAKVLAGARAIAGGSKITKGPLKLPGGGSFGPSRPGIGSVIAGGTAVAAGLGLATGAFHKAAPSRKPKKQTAGQYARSNRRRSSVSRGSRCGCKAGTKKVCFRTGVRNKKSRRGGSRTAAQKRFAAAARRYGGRIPKGSSL